MVARFRCKPTTAIREQEKTQQTKVTARKPMTQTVSRPDSEPHTPIEVEVFRHLFTALAEEMGAALRKAAFSANIKERRDYSCALFSPEGDPIAQGDHMPVHIGAMPMSAAAALDALGPLSSGDVAVLNDPFEGGTHLPDITVLAPVVDGGGKRLGYVAARAHHSDIGGMSPGSMPIAREIFQEGLRIPPVLLVQDGTRVRDVWKLVLANVRTPEEREGDLEAQLGALHAGVRRLLEISDRVGVPRLLGAQQQLLEYGDLMLREGIRRIPDGVWHAEDTLEGDGMTDDPITIRASLTIAGDRVHIDFSGTGPQAEGGVNAVAAVTLSACRYVVRCVIEDLLAAPLPAGGGPMAALEVRLPTGSVVNASVPAAVAAGNVETSQRITDVLLRAFAGPLPDRIPALSQGTMNNVAMGGMDERRGKPFTYYETIGGGMGGGPDRAGLSGVHTHMSNTLNTPIEALEHAYPLRVRRYSVVRGSGGDGQHRGGDGLQRDLELLSPARITLWTERRRTGPDGRAGGEAGAPGQNRLELGGEVRILASKTTFSAPTGAVVCITSPGGGGWGAADEAPSR
jgi:N-methylhydantoinase B